jgi:hypothetical protein
MYFYFLLNIESTFNVQPRFYLSVELNKTALHQEDSKCRMILINNLKGRL